IRGRALKTRPPHRVRTSSTSRSLHLSKSIVLVLEPANFAGSHSLYPVRNPESSACHCTGFRTSTGPRRTLPRRREAEANGVPPERQVTPNRPAPPGPLPPPPPPPP